MFVFPIFMLLVRDYYLQCTYNISRFTFLFNIGKPLFSNHWIDASTPQEYIPAKLSDFVGMNLTT